MNVITLRTLLDFTAQHPEAEKPVHEWYRHVRARTYHNFAEVKEDFGSADWVAGLIVFNIGGNKYLLIVNPNFQHKSFFVKFIGTHAEYDAWRPL